MPTARAILPLLAAAALAAPAGAQEPMSEAPSMAGRSTVYAPRGVVATSHPLASAEALKILQDGGNAFDAAVAAVAILNVVEPHMTGIGGDMFALFWSAEEGRLVGLDASGRSGSLMTPERLKADGHDDVPGSGAAAVTVPGALSGWATLLEDYGTLSLGQAFAPAIRIAEEGWPVSPIIAEQWEAQTRKLLRDDGAAATYLVDGERAPEAGEWFTNPDMARTFRRVAEGGTDVFYGGDLGREIVDRVRELGGYLTLDDLRDHEVRWVEPLSVDYKGYTLWELPPAGQGIAALQMLKMLEGYDLKSMGHNTPEYLHHLIEAKKLAHADADRYVADADHMDVTTDAMLDPAYLRRRGGLIDPSRAAEEPKPGALVTESETIYLAVADRHGNMVSFISSVYGYFGSGVVVPGTGFALQNRGAGFTFEEGHPNRVGPGKRPFHTIIPAFVTRDGAPWMAFGVMGGSMQPQGHVQVLLNLLEFGMDPQEANDAARFRHLSGQRVAIEKVDPAVQSALEALGHEFVDWRRTDFGGSQMVIRLERGWAAGSDPRKDGLAIGH